MPFPNAQDAVRRLLILLKLKSHAIRLRMLWDYTFGFAELAKPTPVNLSSVVCVERLKLKGRWLWLVDGWRVRRAFRLAGLACGLSRVERKFLRLRLSTSSKAAASQFLWQIEGAACIAWALRLLPRIWPMDEQFDGNLDEASLGAPERRLIETASLRPMEEIQAACDRVKLWRWRARQGALEQDGYTWPPKDASSEMAGDLRSKGLDTLDGIVRATARSLHKQGILEETIDEDFIARGKPYRALSNEEASEMRSIAMERHEALNWLCGLAPGNDWDAVPTDT
jgi:hypothetical protein